MRIAILTPTLHTNQQAGEAACARPVCGLLWRADPWSPLTIYSQTSSTNSYKTKLYLDGFSSISFRSFASSVTGHAVCGFLFICASLSSVGMRSTVLSCDLESSYGKGMIGSVADWLNSVNLLEGNLLIAFSMSLLKISFGRFLYFCWGECWQFTSCLSLCCCCCWHSQIYQYGVE